MDGVSAPRGRANKKRGYARWTPEEEACLRSGAYPPTAPWVHFCPLQRLEWGPRATWSPGVEQHGVGKWKRILSDEVFAPILSGRSNVDLKARQPVYSPARARARARQPIRPP